MAALLFITILLIAACGLIYELIAGALASYLLGDTVMQFSTVIGTYLFAMGLGSWASRYVRKGLAQNFLWVELLVAVFGGLSASILFLTFAYTQGFRVVLYVLVIVIGMLVGLEVPLLMRILQDRFELRDVVAHVLGFDYLGALFASLLFPLWLVPQLGLVRGAAFFGLINAAVALWGTHLFRTHISAIERTRLRIACIAACVLLSFTIVESRWITGAADESMYSDEVIFSKDTHYQHIAITKWREDLRLYLNGHLQFSSRDEYRYHEPLVHPGLAALPHARRVLVLGGGDGLAIREVLKYPGVEHVTQIELDPEMTKLFREQPMLTALNQSALNDKRVEVINADAFVWLDQHDEMFDFAIVDFPDPTNYSIGKLFTTAFYRLLARHIAHGGSFVVQSTSPMFARESYWSIVATLKEAGLAVYPYHAYVPSFGEWGFALATANDIAYVPPKTFPVGLRYLTPTETQQLFQFPADMTPVRAQANHLNDQPLVRTLEKEWRSISH